MPFIEVRLLGSLELDVAERRVELSRSKQRALLALLALRAGEVVSTDRLVDELWSGAPPKAAVGSLQNLVSDLRKVLPPEVLVSKPPGYVLEVERDAIDVHRFEHLAEMARDASSPKARCALLREALTLWRGPALADIPIDGVIAGEARRLEELRAATREDRLQTELDLGGHAQLIGELEAHATEHPLRERPTSLLMLALYRSGRQAEALAVYRQAREDLIAHLGIEPWPELQRLQQAILRQDPKLDLPESAVLGQGDFTPLEGIKKTNLPVASTPFLGRSRELLEVTELLEKPEVRLLTLTGAGGTGKTRLGIAAASERVGDYDHGVWWVPLAALRDPMLVLESVAETLGADDELAEHIADKRMLILLDNFEHLVEAGPGLAELLELCTNVDVLVTSRVPLHLSAEREYAVPPLSEVEAIALFRQRAVEAAPDQVVAEICRRIDCLPLAIELAAARTKVLSPPAILSRLEQRLAFLTGGPRDAPERQRTLEATIAWSYDLLAAEEKRLFDRLSVFTHGCTLESAEAVGNVQLDALQALVDQSLLLRTGDRFWMLETIQEFAHERLQESGEEEHLRRRHAEWFLDLAERAESSLRTPDFKLQLDRLAADHDNFRSALAWMLARGELELEVRLASALQPFFEARGHFSEGRRWLEAGLHRRMELPVAVSAKAVYGLGRLLYGQGDYGQAAAHFTEACESFRAADDAAGVVQALTELAGAERRRGDLERADALSREAIELARNLGDFWDLSSALHSAALTAHESGDRRQALTLGEESLELRRQIGDVLGTSHSLDLLGWVNLVEGDPGRAAILFEEALSLARDVNDAESIANALDNLGLVALKLGDYDRAADHIVESLTLAVAMGHRTLAAECLGGLAAVAAGSGSPDRFARLLGASEGLHEALGIPFNEIEQWIQDRFVKEARADLGEHVFSVERTKGKAMSLEQALEYASSGTPTTSS